MLEKINDLPEHVFGVRAKGEVTGEDLKTVLFPGLEELSHKFNKIHYLLVLDTDVKNFTTSAWIQDMLAGIKHLSEWKKIGIVTDQKGVRKFTDMFSVVAPGEARGFRHNQLEQAIAWVSAEDGQAKAKTKLSFGKIALITLGAVLIGRLFRKR